VDYSVVARYASQHASIQSKIQITHVHHNQSK
jgi:hypothetical protein